MVEMVNRGRTSRTARNERTDWEELERNIAHFHRPFADTPEDEVALLLNVARAKVRADIQVADFHISTERNDSHAQD